MMADELVVFLLWFLCIKHRRFSNLWILILSRSWKGQGFIVTCLCFNGFWSDGCYQNETNSNHFNYIIYCSFKWVQKFAMRHVTI